ncbi:hypothetical protein J6590_025172 [Homalodisca vitripennis]|nr:hypothetical protein J6590_025172 [Homalodisca vitripennis]
MGNGTRVPAHISAPAQRKLHQPDNILAFCHWDGDESKSIGGGNDFLISIVNNSTSTTVRVPILGLLFNYIYFDCVVKLEEPEDTVQVDYSRLMQFIDLGVEKGKNSCSICTADSLISRTTAGRDFTLDTGSHLVPSARLPSKSGYPTLRHGLLQSSVRIYRP